MTKNSPWNVRAMAGLVGGCAVLAVAGAAGCVVAQESTSSSSGGAALTADLQVLTSAALPACTTKTSGETAIVTSTDTFERCVAKTWTVVACTASMGGTVLYSSATSTLWACTNNPDGGPPAWLLIGAPAGGGSDNWNDPGTTVDAGSSDNWNNPGTTVDAGSSDNWNNPGATVDAGSSDNWNP